MSDLEHYRCYQCRRGYADCTCPPAFTPEEYEAIANAAIASQALSGVAITREEVDAAWEAVRDEPLPDIGESFAAAYLACNVAAWRDREKKSR